jgi:hypothetical protein
MVTTVPPAKGSITTESISSSMIARPSPPPSFGEDSSCQRPWSRTESVTCRFVTVPAISTRSEVGSSGCRTALANASVVAS